MSKSYIKHFCICFFDYCRDPQYTQEDLWEIIDYLVTHQCNSVPVMSSQLVEGLLALVGQSVGSVGGSVTDIVRMH